MRPPSSTCSCPPSCARPAALSSPARLAAASCLQVSAYYNDGLLWGFTVSFLKASGGRQLGVHLFEWRQLGVHSIGPRGSGQADVAARHVASCMQLTCLPCTASAWAP